MKTIDLNCDLGESFGNYRIGMDDEVIPLISSANIACGFHASDPCIMEKTVALARKTGCSVGAHPGLPDLVGFGRRNMQISCEEAKAAVIYQIGALEGFCREQGIKLHHVKPHGALYNMAAVDYELAHSICEAILAVNPDLILLGLAGSQMSAAAQSVGLRYANEVFADRAYNDDGTLVSRKQPGAMITDEDTAVDRVVGMVKEHTVLTITGREIEMIPDSICVHGDNEKALVFVKKIRAALFNEGIQIAAF